MAFQGTCHTERPFLFPHAERGRDSSVRESLRCASTGLVPEQRSRRIGSVQATPALRFAGMPGALRIIRRSTRPTPVVKALDLSAIRRPGADVADVCVHLGLDAKWYVAWWRLGRSAEPFSLPFESVSEAIVVSHAVRKHLVLRA
jgi:hypothetical protein